MLIESEDLIKVLEDSQHETTGRLKGAGVNESFRLEGKLEGIALAFGTIGAAVQKAERANDIKAKAKENIVRYQRILQDYARRIAKYQAAETLDEDDMERRKSLEFRQISARNEAAAVQEAYEAAGLLTEEEVMDCVVAAGPVDGRQH